MVYIAAKVDMFLISPREELVAKRRRVHIENFLIEKRCATTWSLLYMFRGLFCSAVVLCSIPKSTHVVEHGVAGLVRFVFFYVLFFHHYIYDSIYLSTFFQKGRLLKFRPRKREEDFCCLFMHAF